MRVMSEKVAVGAITYAGHKSYRHLFFNYLASLTYPRLHFIFATNSGEEDKKDIEAHAKRVGISATVLLNDIPVDDNLDHLVNNRNVVREYFLTQDFDFLYFLDTDCIGERNIIERSLAHKKNLVTGWYLSFFVHPETKKQRILPVAYTFFKEDGNMQLSIVDVIQPRFEKISEAGLGCCLIHRSILEKISFRRKTGSEDVVFFHDARKELGEDLWLDTRLKFQHLKFPLGDERNKLLNPDNYQMNIRKK